jgi:signal transduction histidine kinase
VEAVAHRWRIRHKLTLGLTLEVGVMLLLLSGAVVGLLSLRSTIRMFESKLAERHAAQRLQERVADLLALAEHDGPSPNVRELQQRITAARNELLLYEYFLTDTVVHHRDADNGYEEWALTAALRDRLQRLEALAQKAPVPAMDSVAVAVPLLAPAVVAELRLLVRESDGLRDIIDTDLNRRIAQGKHVYRVTIIIVLAISAAGGLCLIGLARLAYRWVADPLRDLHAKVRRVAEGNFDSRVEVHSGDELQDLADAFNEMIGKLNTMYRDLERQVNERSRQLVRSERLAGVGFLAAGVAHEINNPLASISFCSEALQRRLDDLLIRFTDHPDVPVIRNYLGMIEQEAFRCKEITQRLLEFSRVGERHRQMTDLAGLVQSVIDMVQHIQSYKGKRVEFTLAQRPHLMLSAPEIKSVVLNLIVNALESMEEGGVLAVTLGTEDGHAVLSFTDSGCGMTEEVLENLFEPFFTRSKTGRGIGLGLSISHRIVTQHGGEIEASSDGPGRGSRFVVRLPLVAPATQPVEAPVRLAA